jgi:hypothetical protein
MEFVEGNIRCVDNDGTLSAWPVETGTECVLVIYSIQQSIRTDNAVA